MILREGAKELKLRFSLVTLLFLVLILIRSYANVLFLFHYSHRSCKERGLKNKAYIEQNRNEATPSRGCFVFFMSHGQVQSILPSSTLIITPTKSYLCLLYDRLNSCQSTPWAQSSPKVSTANADCRRTNQVGSPALQSPCASCRRRMPQQKEVPP